MADDLENTIENEATSPESIERDGIRVKRRSISELILGDKYLAGKTAAAAGATGIRLVKIIAPGSSE